MRFMRNAKAIVAATAIGSAILVSLAVAQQTSKVDFSDETAGAESKAFVSVVGVWRIEAEPFGTTWRTRTGAAADQRLRFPGQEFDAQSPERGYNVFRWYRQGWGRYAQSDPIEPEGDADRWRELLLRKRASANPAATDPPMKSAGWARASCVAESMSS